MATYEVIGAPIPLKVEGDNWLSALGAALGAFGLESKAMSRLAINVGKDLGLLSEQLFAMFVIMCLLTTVSTGPMLHAWLPADLKKLVPR